MFTKRRVGALLHYTSLPGPYGCGDMGPGAYKFAEHIASEGFSVWQMLPLGPVNGAFGYSPYTAQSAFAGNYMLISPDLLARDGLLTDADLADTAVHRGGACDFAKASAAREKALRTAFAVYERTRPWKNEEEEFCANSPWLEPWCLFAALKERFGQKAWTDWPSELQDLSGLDEIKRECAVYARTRFEMFVQLAFHRQALRLRRHCNGLGVKLLGDMPIYVAFDSADAWWNRSLFQTGPDGRPSAIAGVPPDYFSKTGQLWGNPLYNWETMEETGYQWWTDRIKHTLGWVDCVRIDHFRGFCGYWSVPADAKTAVDGQWMPGPGEKFMDAVVEAVADKDGALPLLAEDLGVITDDVRELMARYNIPGMNVLMFAFGGDDKNLYLPHNHVPMSVVYTGTHDNNTVAGWWGKDATPQEKADFSEYLGKTCTLSDVSENMVRMAMQSVSRMAVISVQDLLGLSGTARMNRPSEVMGNWVWRMTTDQMESIHLCRKYGR